MQFGELLEHVYIACGLQVLRRAATGGSTTTVIDTGIANEFQENEFTGTVDDRHILFVVDTTDDLAPKHEFGEVSAFATPTSTPTFTVPTMSAAVASGDVYALMEPSIPLQEMISAVNRGLKRLPTREKVDTSLTTAASTLNYTLPLPVNRYTIQKIEIGNNTDGWEDAPGFTIVPNAAGTQDILLFTHQPPYDSTTAANKTIKITWRFVHPTLSTYSDYIEKSVPDEVAIALCADAAMEYLMKKNPTYFRDQNRREMYQDTRTRAQEAQFNNVVRTVPSRRQNRFNLREL
jgi:hypothetical protein